MWWVLVIVEVRALLLVVVPHQLRGVWGHPAHVLLYRGVGQEAHVGARWHGAAPKACTGQTVHRAAAGGLHGGAPAISRAASGPPALSPPPSPGQGHRPVSRQVEVSHSVVVCQLLKPVT